jgi:hypothetical protein
VVLPFPQVKIPAQQWQVECKAIALNGVCISHRAALLRFACCERRVTPRAP